MVVLASAEGSGRGIPGRGNGGVLYVNSTVAAEQTRHVAFTRYNYESISLKIGSLWLSISKVGEAEWNHK